MNIFIGGLVDHVIASALDRIGWLPPHLPMDHDEQIPGCFSLSLFKFRFGKVNATTMQKHIPPKSPTVETARVSARSY